MKDLLTFSGSQASSGQTGTATSRRQHFLESNFQSPLWGVGSLQFPDTPFVFMSRAACNLLGQKFGRLTAVERAPNGRFKHARWLCRCECGGEKVIYAHSLKSGTSKSCGCAALEAATTHGQCGSAYGGATPEYNAWLRMRDRILNKNNKDYARYTGRGITICDRWSSFENFVADMGARPSPLHTIDRVNNNLGYSPGNCRWATRKEQSRNRSNNLALVTLNGVTKCLKDWSDFLGIRYQTLRHRHHQGYSPEEILSVASLPTHKQKASV